MKILIEMEIKNYDVDEIQNAIFEAFPTKVRNDRKVPIIDADNRHVGYIILKTQEDEDKYEYIVSIEGGLGPESWDTEIIIKAENIHSAIHKIEVLHSNSDIIYIYRKQ